MALLVNNERSAENSRIYGDALLVSSLRQGLQYLGEGLGLRVPETFDPAKAEEVARRQRNQKKVAAMPR